MRRPWMILSAAALAVGCLAALPAVGQAKAGATIALPAPQLEGGRPLMEVLKDRHSTRSFSTESLPMQELSNLLWAAWGVNRPDSGKRTAPSAVNWQEIDVYLTTAEGVYLFDAQAHALKLVRAEDLRRLAGRQGFVAEAPVNLVYVADLARMGRASEEEKAFYSAADTGFIAQNVYLYCASEGLGTVVRALIDRRALAEALGLRPEQRITLAQTIGYPE